MSRFKFFGFAARYAKFKKDWVGEVYVGKDFDGNKYYEIPADPSRGIKQQRRVEPLNANITVVPKLPVEWMTWLQKGRASAPSEEELLRNHLIKEKTLARAKELDEAWEEERKESSANNVDERKQKSSEIENVPFPKRDDYELQPGESEYEVPKEAFQESMKNKK